MNYSLIPGTEYTRGFEHRYTKPLWLHGNVPRVPEDKPYIIGLDFTDVDLEDFRLFYQPEVGDVLEIFDLTRRVLLIGVKITVLAHADIRFNIVTNGDIVFDQVDCSKADTITYLVNHGTLSSSTAIAEHSVLIEQPDFIGLQIAAGAESLQYLNILVQLVVRDEYEYSAPTNSTK